MVLCGENYHMEISDKVADPALQPNLCYNRQLTDWSEFVKRSPEEYERWVTGVGEEVSGFEIAELIARGRDRKVIVDTCIPLAVLKKISDWDHVAVMLSPQSMSVERFFDRSDPEKQFLLRVIDHCEDPEAVLANFRACIARVNSPERYREYAESGFFTLVREDDGRDPREEMCDKLARHFGLIKD